MSISQTYQKSKSFKLKAVSEIAKVDSSFSKSGYTFVNWLGSDGNTYSDQANVKFYGNTFDLTAQWAKNMSYTVTFNPNGGTCSTTSKVVESGKAIGELPTCTKDGYIFLGWVDNQSLNITQSYIVTKDITLYGLYISDIIRLKKINSATKDDNNHQIYTFNGSTSKGYFQSEEDIFLPLNSELVIRAMRTGSTTTEYQLFSVEGSYIDQVEVGVLNNKFLLETSSYSVGIKTSGTNNVNQWYYFKIKRITEEDFELYYADATETTENPTYIKAIINQQIRTVGGKLTFGVDASTGGTGSLARQWYWQGKIDFDNSYLIINNIKHHFQCIE